MGKSTVLVTGAGGFIGRHVVERLVARGHEVRATDLPGVDRTFADGWPSTVQWYRYNRYIP